VKSRIAGGGQPILHKLLERFGRHSGVGGGEENFPVRFREPADRRAVVGKNRLERIALFPFGMLGSQIVHTG